jgi:hypothetical protein
MQSQNTVENAFLSRMALLSPLIEQAVLMFDRGFRRVSFIAQALLLREHPFRPGQVVNLGICALRRDARVKARIVGVGAQGQQEPWWLAIHPEDSAGGIAESYDRRMAVEEQFRDGKGCRFGIKMKWTPFQACNPIDRLFLLCAIALWTLAGLLAWRSDPSMALPVINRPPHRSLISIGIDAKEAIQAVLQMGHIALRKLWPPGEIRPFAW